ncbi:hypothetical protein IGL76_001976 [Enterococcus sp. DIV2381]|uniref:Transposase n=1 Tax=Candidatus Enterococcus mangumiae TaxID=2230878 RepID=A0ABZ2SS09_9ENTE
MWHKRVRESVSRMQTIFEEALVSTINEAAE